MVSHLEVLFPGLVGSAYQITSPQSDVYNCIAWAAGPANVKFWWWPFGDPARIYWPEHVPREETVEAFRQLFTSLGYALCEHGALEAGFEKIALYADDERCPLHAARQLPDGHWTSKLGAMEDIKHGLQDLVGTEYGSVVLFMRRVRTDS